MSGSQLSLARHARGVLARIVPDRRRHKRVSLNLLGRFMRENRQEYPCSLLNISVGGVAVSAPVTVELGERVVAYFDQLIGIEGRVVREVEGGFAFKIQATQHRREKLGAQLTWLVNRNELGGIEERVHERIALPSSHSTLHLPGGNTLDCRVLDISISGASIATSARPEIGTEVMLGKLRGRVMRHHGEGIGVRFIDIQNPAALRRYFGQAEPVPAKG
ncbi:MAG TPA: PilZ domain-containing protein [Hyphomicrobiaceae bacterium]|nr:PilZ domain-containing protein [Hyphomicrobiaceae bacterium]